ncbi:MAG: hypothetical protein FWD96_03830 [Defluviitaleaceae bacterium]|nr:hypothetical protein [Defluviitaleaceae bacterium]
MRRELSAYTNAKKDLLTIFGCEVDLPAKVLMEAAWHVEENDGVSFLHYEQDGEKLVSVIVNKGGVPWMCKLNDITLVVAIDCIKFAFILKNKMRTENTGG